MSTRAGIDAGSQSLLWGVGLFETMLVIRGRVIFEQRHYERLCNAARALVIPEPARDAWTSAIDEALRNGPGVDEHALRCSWIDAEPHGSIAGWTVIASAFEIPAITSSRRRHGRVVLLPPTIQRAMPGVKSLSHLASVIGLRMAHDSGADEGLFTAADGRILEGTSTNVFAIDGETLLTPPLDAGVLPGIVRAWVIENARRVGLTVDSRRLDRDDLLRGSFLTSSLTRLAPIRLVDGEPTRDPGERFQHLARLFDDEL